MVDIILEKSSMNDQRMVVNTLKSSMISLLDIFLEKSVVEIN